MPKAVKDKPIADEQFFGTESVWRILLRIAPPVIFAQLIQALYNIVDSYFVGKYLGAGLTALSVVFPIQLIISALAIGTGVGVNIHMAACTRSRTGRPRTGPRVQGWCWRRPAGPCFPWFRFFFWSRMPELPLDRLRRSDMP